MTVVPLYPPHIDGGDEFNRLRASAPIMGPGQWREYAKLLAWLVGRGCTLVSAAGAGAAFAEPDFLGINDGSSEVYRYWTWPHEANPARTWTVTLSRWPAGTQVFGTISRGSFSRGFLIPADAGAFEQRTFELRERLTGSLPQECILTVEHDAASHDTAQLFVHAIRCDEAPRVVLDEDFPPLNPPNLASLDSGRLIYEDSTGQHSLNAVAAGTAAAIAEARRACLYSYFNPYGITTSSTSFDNVLAAAAMPRKRYNGQTVQTIQWAVYGWADGGAGEVRVTADSGDTVTESLPTVAPGWVTGEIDVEVDDISRLPIDGGWPAGGTDGVRVACRQVTTGDAWVWGFCMGEDQ